MRWISTAASLLWQSVGRRWVLLPAATATATGYFLRGAELPEGSTVGQIPIGWAIGALIVLFWVIVGVVKTATRLQQQVDNEPIADAPAQEVFRYLILDSQWAVGRDGSSDNFYTDVEGEIHDAASLGRVQVWARPPPEFGGRGFRETPFEVSKNLWVTARFDLTTCMGQVTKTARIIDYATTDSKSYEDVRLNWAQVTALWPKASWLQRRGDVARKSREDVLEEERKESEKWREENT